VGVSPGYAAVALHLDSMAQAADYPQHYLDPTYRQVLDRFLDLGREFRFHYSMYAIGRDLEDDFACDRLADLARQGHEIGNHTWSHYTDLGALPPAEMRSEIARTHQALVEKVGVTPRGFISPGWSYSSQLMALLNELGYRYDMSLFPSLLYYPFVVKNALNHIGHSEKLRRVLNRRDWLQPIVGSREPHLQDQVVVLPVPTTPGPLGMAVWHTTGFLLGWERHFELLRAAIKARRFFYYVVHPADLTCDDDFSGAEKFHLERAGGNREQKTEYLRQSLAVIAEANREWVTLDKMAELVRVEAQVRAVA
jgi:peptidoglycan/xylan/chitin deacetylase (PgdA/CDA1 family)